MSKVNQLRIGSTTNSVTNYFTTLNNSYIYDSGILQNTKDDKTIHKI